MYQTISQCNIKLNAYTKRILSFAGEILSDLTHTLFEEYQILPYNRRHKVPKVTNRLMNSFIPQYIIMLNKCQYMDLEAPRPLWCFALNCTFHVWCYILWCYIWSDVWDMAFAFLRHLHRGDFFYALETGVSDARHIAGGILTIKVIKQSMYKSNTHSIWQQIARGSRVWALATRQFCLHISSPNGSTEARLRIQPGIPANRNTTNTV